MFQKQREKHWPDQIDTCYIEGKELIVPSEHEQYYVHIWAWQRDRFHNLDKHKFKYLKAYEEKFGAVTRWIDSTGLRHSL